MPDLVGVAPAALVGAAALYRLPALWRRPHDLALRAYWMTLVFLALAMTVLFGPVYLAIDGFVGRGNIARLLGNAFGLAACCSVQAFLIHLNYAPDEARRRIRRVGWLLAVALVLMGVLFFLAPIHEEALAFETRYAGAPFVIEYRLVFFAYVAFALVNVVRLATRFARQATRPSLRHGLHLVAVGGVSGLAYLTLEATRLVAARAGARTSVHGVDPVAALLILGAVGLTVVGSTMPAWGAHLGYDRLVRWIGRYRSYHRLFPLWLDLYRTTPDIVLVPSGLDSWRDLWPFDLNFRLYRRVVEIRDALLVLRSYLDAETMAEAKRQCQEAGLDGDDVEAVTEAAGVAVAVRRRLAGKPRRTRLDTAIALGSHSTENDIQALERLSVLYRHSPSVHTVAARLANGTSVEEPDSGNRTR